MKDAKLGGENAKEEKTTPLLSRVENIGSVFQVAVMCCHCRSKSPGYFCIL